MKTRLSNPIRFVLSLALALIAGTASAQELLPCTTKAYVRSRCYFTVDQSAVLDTNPTGPVISYTANDDGTRKCTVEWTDNGSYKVGIRPEPDQPVVPFTRVDVYYAVDRPTITGASLVCAWTSGSDYSATTSNDNNVHDFTWDVSPSNAYVGLSKSGDPTGTNLHINWNANYTGNVTVTAYSHGFGEDQQGRSISVNRHAMEMFTAQLVTPDHVCEGVQFNLSAQVSHPATYKWFLEDDSRPFSESQTAPATPIQNTSYRLRVTPNPSNDCLTDYKAVELKTNTGSVSFHVTPRLNVVDITNNVTLRCNGGGAMNLTFDADGSYTNASWSIASSGSVSPGSTTGDILNWNSAFIGTAILKVDVTGCNGVLSDQMNISVVQTPTHKSLVGTNGPICPNTTTPVSLTNSGTVIPEMYELIKVNNPGPAESITSMSTTSSSGWQLGPGTYYVSTTAQNCPTDVTDRFVISPLIHLPVFQTSAGTLVEIPGQTTLKICDAIGFNLSVSEATNLRWYRYNDVCLSNNVASIPPHQRWEYCHTKFLRPDGTPYDGATSLPLYSGADKMITIRGEDDVCHQVFEKDIVIRTTAGVTFTGISPLMTARVAGSGATAFDVEYQGILLDQAWEISPAAAGTISTVGTVDWSAAFSSYENGQMTRPVTITAKMKGCGGWTEYPFEMRVVPVLDFDENRVRTFVPQDTMRFVQKVLDNMDDPFKVRVSAAYFDGLGRNVQSVQYFSSTSNKDLVELKIYDEFGREAIKNLPFAIAHSFTYPNGAITQQAAFYNLPPVGIPTDSSAFARAIFEPAPLNRVIEQGAPGGAWQPGSGHTVTKKYLLNAGSEVMRFLYNSSTRELMLSAAPPSQDAFYKENNLSVNKTTDEEHNDVLEFVDKEGRTICKKVKASNGGYASTYYIYDDFGGLVVVLPPEAVERIVNPNRN